ncbi:ALG3-like protein [Elsinoe australis]|uniref:Dol-P-Man:Man(5)GlcNAc(2)-PP-Dol alpha-1,3-mannosyltransferase n=1 Tax=Elsinoe australis TaxID=40998 RepID=A0A4U7AW12_9PEZI|nr:ALG3-like protein [Elsinoe australis]
MAQRPMDLFDKVLAIANDPWHTRWLCPLLVAGDAVLTAGIVWKVPYTEIDWKAYMQQITTYLSGERNYTKITGSTGPLVYPAMHVHLYNLLHRLTTSGTSIPIAQYLFGALYLLTLALVLQVHRHVHAPPWLLPLLCLSKRLHSIYVLRLFNDCFAIFFLWLAIYLLQRKNYKAAALSYSLGLATKMSLLLVLPAVGWVLYMALGPGGALATAGVMLQYQVLVAWPFISQYPFEYLGRAFEFGRRFEWKWTVNWRWVGREGFEDDRFASALMVGHVVVLGLFVVERWMRQAGTGVGEVLGSLLRSQGVQRMREVQGRVTPEFVLTAILTSNAVGMLFARSLHYQFYSWLAWGSPYLLWRSGTSPVAVVLAWAAQEWAWNVYPSTTISSAVVVLSLAWQVYGIWAAPPIEELWRRQESIVKGEKLEKESIELKPTRKVDGGSRVDIDAVLEEKETLTPSSSKKRGRKR